MDRIVADRKKAIPILIEQITDERRMQDPVLAFWPSLSAGELAVLIPSPLRRLPPEEFGADRLRSLLDGLMTIMP